MPHRGVAKTTLLACAILPSVALGLLNDLYLEPLARFGAVWFWAADLVQFVVVPALAVLLLIEFGGITPRDYGFRSFGPGTSAAGAAGLCLSMCALYWLAYEPVKQISYRLLGDDAGTFGYGSMLPHSSLLRLPLVLYLSATAALAEEAVFRGLPWLYLSQYNLGRLRVPIYIVSTCVVFSAIHSEQGLSGMLAALSLGLVAATLYVRIQNIWPFVAAHFVTDMISFW